MSTIGVISKQQYDWHAATELLDEVDQSVRTCLLKVQAAEALFRVDVDHPAISPRSVGQLITVYEQLVLIRNELFRIHQEHWG